MALGLVRAVRRVVAIVVFAACGASALFWATRARGNGSAPPAWRAAELERFLETELAHAYIPGAALVVVERGVVVQLLALGRATASRRITPQTPFLLGSVSKSITALCVLQLVEAGKLELDAPVTRYLPAFELADRAAAARISVRHLLNHTSGLSRLAGRTTFDSDDSPATALGNFASRLAREKLVGKRGEFRYANANYQLLGAIIEAVSSQTYAAYVEEHVFRVLGMRHSFAGSAPLDRELTPGYRYWFGFPIAARRSIAAAALPSGELAASAEDLGRYLRCLLNGGTLDGQRVLSREGVETLLRPSSSMRGDSAYAMGWFVASPPARYRVWHEGSLPNFHSHVALEPETASGFALLVNAESYLSGPQVKDLGLQVLRVLRGEAPRPIRFARAPLPLLALITLLGTELWGFVVWWRALRRKSLARSRWLIVAPVAQLGLALALLFGVPRTQQADLVGVLEFAPDAGALLLANLTLGFVGCALLLAEVRWSKSRR